jgi:multimeric flavodoxin WrbA
VLEDIRKADAVIFSTPICFGQLNGQCRMFEDRMLLFIDAAFRSNLELGKKAVIVPRQGNPDAKAFENASADFGKIMSMARFHVVDTITMSNGNNPGTAKERKHLLEGAKMDRVKAGYRLLERPTSLRLFH